jgi:hypothetical protein
MPQISQENFWIHWRHLVRVFGWESHDGNREALRCINPVRSGAEPPNRGFRVVSIPAMV